MASDVVEFQIQTLLDCLEEVTQKLALPLSLEFDQLKKCIQDPILVNKNASSSSSSSLLPLLNDLTDAVAECSLYAEQTHNNVSQGLSSCHHYNPFHHSFSVRKMRQKLKSKRDKLAQIISHLQISPTTLFPSARYTCFHSNPHFQLIGFDELENQIEGLIISQSSYKAIGVYGMAGSGKTALILKLLNSHTVRNQFSPIIWLCLSDINSKEDAEYEVNIVKFILCEMGCDVDKWTVINPSMPRLLKHLKNLLMSNKYLIVFDDVWENNEFYANLGDPLPLPLPESNTLSEGLPRDSGGRVIITSRLKEVVKNMVGEKNLIPMMPLSRESCRMIIEDDLFSEYTKKVEAFLNGNEYVSIGIYGPSSPANTNVARRVLSSPSVGEKFEPIIWVPISLIFMNCDLINAWNDPSNVGDDIWRKYNNAEVEIMKHVLKELGRDIDEIDFTQHKINYHELREMVERSLASKKYLIVLADVMLDNSDFWGRILSMWPTNGGGALIQICKSGELIDFADHLLHVRLPEWGSNQVEGNEVVIDGHYVSDDIVDQCAGLPFAANTMANLIIITSRLKQESDSDEASEHRNLQW